MRKLINILFLLTLFVSGFSQKTVNGKLLVTPDGHYLSYTFDPNPWTDQILVDYFIRKGAYNNDTDFNWALTNLREWLNSSYVQNTFGIDGSNEDKADFFLLLRHDGNTTTNTISKTGATLRHDIGNSTYNQDNVPAHTYDGNERWVISSTDGFLNMTLLTLINQNIVTSVYFNISITSCVVRLYNNNDIPTIRFLVSSDVSELRISNNSLLVADLSNCTINGGNFYMDQNPGLNSFSLSNTVQSATSLRMFTTAVTDPDFSNFTLSGILQFQQITGLNSITFSSSGNSFTNFLINNNVLSSLDLTGFDFTNAFLNITSCTNLTSLIFNTNANSLNDLLASFSNLLSLDLSNVQINSILRLNGNSSLTSLTLKSSGNTAGEFRVDNCDLSSLDVSGFIFQGTFLSFSNTSLSSITWAGSPFTTGLNLLLANDCALPTSEVDEIFSLLNTYFSSNTPVTALTVNVSGGTNASPTGGASNTDIVNLESIFSGASQTLTITIN